MEFEYAGGILTIKEYYTKNEFKYINLNHKEAVELIRYFLKKVVRL